MVTRPATGSDRAQQADAGRSSYKRHVARLGGDEFVAVCEDVNEQSALASVVAFRRRSDDRSPSVASRADHREHWDRPGRTVATPSCATRTLPSTARRLTAEIASSCSSSDRDASTV